MAKITKEHAEKIAKKLGAQMDQRKGRPHELAKVYHNGKLVTSFGIRRGSKKDAGHDHIPGSLYTTPSQARLLSDCPWSKGDWLAHLDNKGYIE